MNQGSARASTRFLSRSVLPTITSSISFEGRARSRTTRGKRPNTFLMGCMRVFSDRALQIGGHHVQVGHRLDISSSLLAMPRLTRRLRTSTSPHHVHDDVQGLGVHPHRGVALYRAARRGGRFGRAALAGAATGSEAGLAPRAPWGRHGGGRRLGFGGRGSSSHAVLGP